MTSHLLPALRRTMVAALTASTLGAAPALLAGEPSGDLHSEARDQQPSPAPSTGQRGADRGRAELQERETRTLALGPSGLLELSTYEGDITVTAGSGTEVRVEITRRARGMSEREVKIALSEVQVGADRKGDRVILAVIAPRRPIVRARVNVSYAVTAPAGTRVVATTLGGNVEIKGIKGETAAQVTSGNITITGAGRVSMARTISGNVTITEMDNPGRLAVSVVSGNVTLDRIKARELDVEVTTGDVRVSDGASEDVEIRSLAGSIDYAGSLVPDGRYRLQTHSGDVRLLIAGKTGFEIQAGSVSGVIKADSGLIPKTAALTPRSLRATVGDGAASVVAMTFSGNVTIGRK